VEKISARLNEIKPGLEVSSAPRGRFPLCFFQPDPSDLPAKEDGQFFAGEVSSDSKNPVTCVFISPPDASSHGLTQGSKVIQPQPLAAREDEDTNFRERKSKAVFETL